MLRAASTATAGSSVTIRAAAIGTMARDIGIEISGVCSFLFWPFPLTSNDPAIQIEAARAWSAWEGRTLSLLPDYDRERLFSEDYYALAFARIECHYFVNRGFFNTDDQLLRDANRLKDIPGVIVHGRYDVVCPIQNAWDLHKAWPKSELMVSAASGHSAFEEEKVDARVRETERFA